MDEKETAWTTVKSARCGAVWAERSWSRWQNDGTNTPMWRFEKAKRK